MSSTCRRSCRTLVLVLLLLGVGPLSRVQGAGSENTLRGHDLQVVVDTRWAGNKFGGYYPIRVRITNTGPTRELRVEFHEADYGGKTLPKVMRTVLVEQNTTQQFSLSVPLVGPGSGGTLQVIHAQTGLPLSNMNASISLPSVVNYGERSGVSLLVISRDHIQLGAFAEAASAHGEFLTRSSGSMYASSGGAVEEHQVIPPNNLPENWLDYTGVDLVALPLEVLEKLPSGARGALLKWVEVGGTLMVYDVKETGPSSAKLATLLELSRRLDKSAHWTAADTTTFSQHQVPVISTSSGFTPPGVMVPPGGGSGSPATTIAAEPVTNAGGVVLQEGGATPAGFPVSAWPPEEREFHTLSLMDGRVIAFAKNPFPGGVKDWSWLLTRQMIQKDGRSRPLASLSRFRDRIGGAPRLKQADFYNFLVPGVGGIHVVPFLGLITLFTVLIGPVNYVLLWRRKQLYLLVVTIPLVAFVTSAALFGYAIIADGFSVQTRIRSYTLIDQGAQTAVVHSRQSYYAGWAPSAGLNFTYNTGVFPVWQEEPGIESGAVDWTQSQHLTGSWLRPRTPTQFLTVSNREFRGRLTVSPLSSGGTSKIRVANGLGANIRQLFVTNEAGEVFLMQQLPANAESELTARTVQPDFSWDSLFDQDSLNLSPNIPYNSGYNRSRHGYGYGYGETVTIPLADGGLERQLQICKTPFFHSGTPMTLRAHHPGKYYLAILEQNPALENGALTPEFKSELHIVRGYY